MFDTLKNTLSHLPVNQIGEAVSTAFAEGKIPVVTSEVASGKTLLLPVLCAELVSEVIYVLEPTRFLSNNATDTMRQIVGEDGARLIGCLNSSRSDDESSVHRDNRIIFTTVGYALGAGIVHKAKNIIFDEAHETSIDLSLAKAIVHKRISDGDAVRTAVFSATIDFENETDFWGETACHFTTKGSAYHVEYLHRPAWSLGTSVSYLIQDEDRRGILVFVSGKEEIQDAVKDIRESLIRNVGMTEGFDYEIMTVHGNSTGEERKLASQNPTRTRKILVGTNVLESGVSLPWVDSGVSSGETKVLHVTGNVHRLVVEKLPRWRIKQEMGRVGRFRPGTFVLADTDALEYRPEMAAPDIVRLPLTELVMHCAKFPDIKIEDLKFSKKEQPKFRAIMDAINTLEQYDLVRFNEDGSLSLTDDGKKIDSLPVSFKAAAAYCEAYHLREMATLLPLIALIEVGDLRHDMRTELVGDKWENSDFVHQVYVIAQMREEKRTMGASLRELAEYHNLSTKKYREFTNLLTILEQRTGVRANYRLYLSREQADREKLDRITKQVIFRSMILELYQYNWMRQSANVKAMIVGGEFYEHAKVSNTSVCSSIASIAALFCTGNPRMITPKRSRAFMVIEMVTMFQEGDISFLIERFGEEKVDPNGIYRQLLDRKKAQAEKQSLNSYRGLTTRTSFTSPGELFNEIYATTERDQPLGSTLEKTIASRPEVKKEPKVSAVAAAGSFGALLQEALNNKK